MVAPCCPRCGSNRILLWGIGAPAKPTEPSRKSPPAQRSVHARADGHSLGAASAGILRTPGEPRQAQEASTAGGGRQTVARHLRNVRNDCSYQGCRVFQLSVVPVGSSE